MTGVGLLKIIQMKDLNRTTDDQGFTSWQRRQRNGRIAGGVAVILAGIVYMLYQMEYQIPEWIFTWPTLILAASVIAAIQHGLNDWRWLILFLIGSVFLGGYIYPESIILQYKIPMVLFIVGIAIIFKPKSKHHQFHKYKMKNSRTLSDAQTLSADVQNEDYLFVNNIFSGVEKVIFSKDFKGGEIKNTFGGCDINLTQADITNEAVLILNQQFSGTKLIIPPHWIIKSDISCIFAGIEDKRPIVAANAQAPTKTLILQGSIFMSGLEIVSY
jgi:predicted membrane protein